MIELRVMDDTHMIYQGKVERIHFPGSYGEFEVADDHVPILSILKKGTIVIAASREAGSVKGEALKKIDQSSRDTLHEIRFTIPIERGVMKLEADRVITMVELANHA